MICLETIQRTTTQGTKNRRCIATPDWIYPDLEHRSRRQLDDEELDSGDDMGRNDRAVSGTPAQEEDQQREELVQYSEFGRQPEPEPTDGEVRPTVSASSDMTNFSRCICSRSPSSFPSNPPPLTHPPSAFRSTNTTHDKNRLPRFLLSIPPCPRFAGDTHHLIQPSCSRMLEFCVGQMDR